jgi:vitamin K-dependent gamma-carboxylase
MRRASGRFPVSLFDEVDNSGLVLYRILFGFLMAWECAGLIVIGWVRKNLVEPSVVFPMIGFEWLPRLPGYAVYGYFAVMALCGALIMAGAFFRPSLALFTLLWTGVYVMQTASYNNHYYLIILLLPTPANADRSWDARRRPELRRLTCPRWCVLTFVVQMAIVYGFAAIAKLDSDWLAARPIEIWLSAKTGVPVLGRLYAEPWLKWALAYGGILFDATVVPLLLWKRTRVLALAAALVFHLFNSVTFKIGIFPYLALSLCVLFFPPAEIGRRFLRRTTSAEPVVASGGWEAGNRRLVAAALAVYFFIQIALPLRHWIYPGNPNWTEEGHRLAWHMMLRTKSGTIGYELRDPTTGRTWRVDPKEHLNDKQAARVATRPDMAWQFAQYLKERYRAEGIKQVEVRAVSSVSLNGRPPQPLIDGSVDLAAEPWPLLAPLDWVVPLRE